MGILEPAEAEIVSPKAVGTWLVPGLAFTRDGKRLGYGGGWYDRLLSGAPKASLKLGIAHAFQVVDDLPCEPHDKRSAGYDSVGRCGGGCAWCSVTDCLRPKEVKAAVAAI